MNRDSPGAAAATAGFAVITSLVLSGLRIGTPALTTRGLVEDELGEVARVIVAALTGEFDAQKGSLLERSRADGEVPALSSAERRSGLTRQLRRAWAGGGPG